MDELFAGFGVLGFCGNKLQNFVIAMIHLNEFTYIIVSEKYKENIYLYQARSRAHTISYFFLQIIKDKTEIK